MNISASLQALLFVNGLTILLLVFFAAFVFPRRPLSSETTSRRRTFISNALFREFWQFLTSPLKNFLIVRGIGPNPVTVAGVVFSGLAGYGLAFSWYGFAGWMLILAASCDMIDGQIAREMGLSKKSGAFFDSTLDRVGEFLITAGLLWHFRDQAFWYMSTFLFTGAAQMTSYARARAEGLGFKGDDGFFQRPERMIVLCIFVGLAPVLELISVEPEIFVQTAVMICLIGSVWTAVSRWFSAYGEIRRAEK